jgi:hypothetical protein
MLIQMLKGGQIMRKKVLILVLGWGLILIGANLYAAGDLQVNGSLGVGVAPTSGFKVDISTTDVRGLRNTSNVTNSATAVMEAANFAVDVNNTSSFGIYYGFANRVLLSGENPSLGRILGGDNLVQFNATSPGTTDVYEAVALRARISNSNDFARTYNLNVSSNSLVGIGLRYSFNATTGGGTINATDLIGLDIDAPSGAPLTVSNLSGIWIDQQVAGTTNNYGLVLDGDGAGSDVVFGPNQEASIYSSGGEIFVKDGATNVTQISPHDPVTGEWVFYSRNIKTGKTVRINMEKLVKAVEKLTGEQFMIETVEEIK